MEKKTCLVVAKAMTRNKTFLSKTAMLTYNTYEYINLDLHN